MRINDGSLRFVNLLMYSRKALDFFSKNIYNSFAG